MTKQIKRIYRSAQSGHLVAYDSSQPPGHQIKIAWRDNLILATSIDNAKALQQLLSDVLGLIDSERSQPADPMTDTRKADASDELIELRARVEALEAQQRKGWRPLNTETVYGSKPAVDTVRMHSYSIGPAKPIGHTLVEAAVKESFTAQPGGLVEMVAEAMQPGTFDWSAYEPEARAAIRAVAAWLRTGRLLHAAELLEQEVDRD
jgi:hypothetical protein